jgi:serine protease AprX
MKKFSWCLLIAMAMVQEGNSQTKYIITFRNKGTNPFSISSPLAYLSQRAIDRRTRYSIAIDSTDLPITPRYLDSIRTSGSVTILNTSRWLNSISILTSDASALTKINSFSFVKAVSPIAPRTSSISLNHKTEDNELPLPQHRENGTLADFYNYGASLAQVHIHNGEFLHNIGLRGQGMQIGMLDAGFNNYLTVKAFDSARINGQILSTWDFVARDNSVNEDDSHGMQCFSTIAANIPGQFVGTAPGASYYLFRSEDAATEFPVEELNWVCAAERVDSSGGDVISSSLGYNTFDPPFASSSHTYADMNGNTTMVATGADLAAKKGILVVNSAGNEGTNTWKYIITPADGDSVLAVGAVNTSGQVASFSSFGPSSDGQVKPDVASVGQGTVVQFPSNVIGTNNGTSFSAPNMAGLATCLWEGFQEFNNMKIIDALRKSGSKSTAPDDRIGYGIPDLKKAVMQLVKDFATTSASLTGCRTTLNWISKDSRTMKYEIERQLPGQSSFVKISDENGSGNVFGNHTYSYEDLLSDIQPGSINYRLRQVIDTSASGFTADYLDTVNVSLTAKCPAVKDSIVLFPNPAGNNFSIRITTSVPFPELSIHIYNAKGQLFATYKRNILPGATRIDIPSGFFATGKYFVTIFNGNNFLETKPLVIIRH